MKPIKKIYGNSTLIKLYCSFCQDYAFIVDGHYTCCRKKVVDIESQKYVIKRECDSIHSNRYLSKKNKEMILTEQSNRCFYCDKTFGSTVLRINKHKEKVINIRPQFDHIIPFVYNQNNDKLNYVAACQICNGIKSDLMFNDLDAAKIYIINRMKEKGYVYIKPSPANFKDFLKQIKD